MNADLRIREAKTEDADEVCALYLELREHHKRLAPENLRYRVGDERWKEVTLEAITGDRHHVLVAEHEDRLVAFAKISFEDKPWGLSCEIDTLVVAEQARGSGIGRAVLRYVEEFAVSKGALGVRVNVLRQNEEGRRFYEQDGYAAAAVRYMKDISEH